MSVPYRQAYLPDQLRFEEWRETVAEDIENDMPRRESTWSDLSPAGQPIMKDDNRMLEMRTELTRLAIISMSPCCREEFFQYRTARGRRL